MVNRKPSGAPLAHQVEVSITMFKRLPSPKCNAPPPHLKPFKGSLLGGLRINFKHIYMTQEKDSSSSNFWESHFLLVRRKPRKSIIPTLTMKKKIRSSTEPWLFLSQLESWGWKITRGAKFQKAVCPAEERQELLNCFNLWQRTGKRKWPP